MALAQTFLLPGFTSKAEAAFKKRSCQLIGNLNQRMKKKGIPGRLELAEGRRILALGVGKPCRFCGNVIKVATMSPDHPVPISRGGDPWLIECICLDCNHIKGEMTAEEFGRFCSHLKTYPPATERYIKGMMKGGAAYQRVLAISRSKFADKRKQGGSILRDMAGSQGGEATALPMDSL